MYMCICWDRANVEDYSPDYDVGWLLIGQPLRAPTGQADLPLCSHPLQSHTLSPKPTAPRPSPLDSAHPSTRRGTLHDSLRPLQLHYFVLSGARIGERASALVSHAAATRAWEGHCARPTTSLPLPSPPPSPGAHTLRRTAQTAQHGKQPARCRPDQVYRQCHSRRAREEAPAGD